MYAVARKNRTVDYVGMREVVAFLPRDTMRCAVLVIVIPSFQLGTVTLAGWLAGWLVGGKSCLSEL